MPFVKLPDGTVAHIRMAKPRRRRCRGFEGTTPCPTAATHQCDFLVAPGRTCDAWICAAHVTAVGRDLDLCPDHQAQRGLFSRLLPTTTEKTR